MIDPALCDRPLSEWIELKVWLRQLLLMPIRAIPILALVACLPWGIPKLGLRWRRGLGAIAALPLIIYMCLPFPPVLHVAEAGLTALLPADRGETVDAIVVLGRGGYYRRLRVDLVQRLWEEGRAPRIFASGRGDGTAIRKGLKKRGVPEGVVAAEDCSQTTEENAQFTAAVLQPEGVKSILLVTDGPHMMRSLLTFKSLGFDAIPHASLLPHQSPRREAMLVAQEYIGFLIYGAKGRYWPQRTPELVDANNQVAIANGQIVRTIERDQSAFAGS